MHHAADETDLPRPRQESAIVLPGGRTFGYAEWGDPDGRAVIWCHGTPGARKQIPPDAPALAQAQGIRLIGIERPGTGLSTPHQYGRVLDWVADLESCLDKLGIDRFGIVGLSGGGPYVLASAFALPDRVVAGAVLGGIGPTRGREAAPGYTRVLPLIEPVVALGRVPLGELLTHAVRPMRAMASQAFDLYAKVAPPSDRPVMRRPEMKAMFLYDLTEACEGGLRAPVNDLVVFGREWGFSLTDIDVPVKFWHGDADGIVPLSHGEYQASMVPDAEFELCPGGGHFAGFVLGKDVLAFIDEHWNASRRTDAAPTRSSAGAR